MSQNQVARQKYAALMAEIEVLEQTVAELEKDVAAARQQPDAPELQSLQEQWGQARVELAQKRGELARVSDGCGRPHPIQ